MKKILFLTLALAFQGLLTNNINAQTQPIPVGNTIPISKARVVNGKLEVTLDVKALRSYAVQYSFNLKNWYWVDNSEFRTGVDQTTATSLFTFIFSPDYQQIFFRLGEVVPDGYSGGTGGYHGGT